ncbi:hypothetical protein BDV30DRAFT_227756 [Aspergillus minisclerotigenes]|uniref:Uncharacterized protein n=1 Tax=Aspergillus minisclerotigenes TaxID=656917 RepID=A0A5N6J2Z0_9EURO|nr:hypothetical protein BDV30DRAFT_227756 [Aspergillus minisclerotigenes]
MSLPPRFSELLPLLSLAYAQGQDPLTARNQALNNHFGEAEYNELGAFCKKGDATCWWSDYDHVADLNTGTADVCINAPGHVYLVDRRESLESCNKAKQEGLEKEITRLKGEVDTSRTSINSRKTVKPGRNSQEYY